MSRVCDCVLNCMCGTVLVWLRVSEYTDRFAKPLVAAQDLAATRQRVCEDRELLRTKKEN